MRYYHNKVWEHLLSRVENNRNRLFIFPSTTFSELFSQSLEKSNSLYSRMKNPYNNRVIVSSQPNTPQYIVELVSIWRNNHVPCLIPNYYNKDMQEHCMRLLQLPEKYPSKDEGLVLFTTGTGSGRPKGVRLSQDNILNQLDMLDKHVSKDLLSSTDRTVSFMPWYHSYGLCELLSIIERGATTYPHTYHNSVHLWTKLQYVQPTVLFVVPRLLELIYDKIQKSPKLYWGLSKNMLRKVWFGTHIRHIISGGATLRQEIKWFYYDRMELPIYQGYGCTEMSPMIAMEKECDPRATHVGSLLPGIWLDDRCDGSIRVNGPNRFLGYLGEPLLSKMEYYDTGDIGSVSEGHLYIRGRSANTIKLSNGKFVNLSELESHLQTQLGIRNLSIVKITSIDDPIAVVFDTDCDGPKVSYTTTRSDINSSVILKLVRLPSSWLGPEMISLKGEILKPAVIKLLSEIHVPMDNYSMETKK